MRFKGYLRLWAPQAGKVGEMLCRVEDVGDAVQDGWISHGEGRRRKRGTEEEMGRVEERMGETNEVCKCLREVKKGLGEVVRWAGGGGAGAGWVCVRK